MLKLIFCFVLCVCFSSGVFASEKSYSPYEVELEVLIHWRGSWGGEKIYTHYSIIASSKGKQIAEFKNDYYIRSDSSYAKEKADQELKRLSSIIEDAKSKGKQVVLNEYYDRYQPDNDGVVITSDDELAKISSSDVSKLVELASLIDSSQKEGNSLRVNKGHLYQIGEQIKKLTKSIMK